jgi:hypothetical protein
MLCRRINPRNAFEAQIRVERGTGSALTADADEFDVARLGRSGPMRAKLDPVDDAGSKRKRRQEAGVDGDGMEEPRLGALGFRRGSKSPRLKRPAVDSSV